MDVEQGKRNIAFRATPEIIAEIVHVAKAEGLSTSASSVGRSCVTCRV